MKLKELIPEWGSAGLATGGMDIIGKDGKVHLEVELNGFWLSKQISNVISNLTPDCILIVDKCIQTALNTSGQNGLLKSACFKKKVTLKLESTSSDKQPISESENGGDFNFSKYMLYYVLLDTMSKLSSGETFYIHPDILSSVGSYKQNLKNAAKEKNITISLKV